MLLLISSALSLHFYYGSREPNSTLMWLESWIWFCFGLKQCKRNPRKVSSGSVNSAREHPQNEVEKVKRNARRASDPTKEVSDRSFQSLPSSPGVLFPMFLTLYIFCAFPLLVKMRNNALILVHEEYQKN